MPSIEQKYQKKTQLEHILLRPDTYIGSTENNKEKLWINENDNKIHFKEINYIPGLYKIFDEILVNAADSSQEDKKTKNIWVNITNKEISIANDGKGIPVVMHSKEKCTIPELIFGHFLTGSNFDDTKKRTTGGRNGYGAKLTNAYSTEFIVEIHDLKNNKYFKQIYKNNMTSKSTPIIEDKDYKVGLVKITFIPDFKKFKVKELSDDMINLFKKRVYDISATTHTKINIFLDGKKINEDNLNKYISLYYNNEDNIIYDKINNNWEIGIIYKPDHMFEHISFVNSINTFNGGTHVKYITDMIIKQLEDIIKKKHKDIKVKPHMLKDHLIIFINCLIDKPQFSSQTKEELKSKPTNFGSTCIINEKIIKKLVSFGIIEQVINFIKIKEEMQIKKKTDGKKLNNLKGIPKLEDANFAGTKKSNECCLIITEGDSAKALAMSGRSVIGNDKYGVFPLKGKLLNIREATAKQQLENEEIKNLKKILGLQENKIYDDTNDLRYGKLLILADQDCDGFHIKGLVMNWIHFKWPSLLKLDFLVSLATPIIRATKKKTIKSFYNIPEYNKWKSSINNNLWHIKYYKGLGTSNASEAKEYFTDIENKLIRYKWDNKYEEDINLSDKTIKLAFEKNQADNRKKWLKDTSQEMNLDYNIKDVYYSDFINKELKLFSYDDLERSIPSIADGLKPSIRKILYSCFLRKLDNKKNEIKVSQLAGYVSDKTNYHHGEKSLNDAIVNMAQNYVGSNNINLLHPSGQFGTRLLNGKDHASPRYTFTFLEKLTRLIYRQEDECILNYLNEDGQLIEPEIFFPIIPMILVNGTEGIGTGFSTFIPQYNPEDIINNIFNIMDKKPLKEMKPWYRNFKGKIKKIDNTITIIGKYKVIDDITINIEELPIGSGITPYKNFLETIEINNDSGKDIIVDFRDNNTENNINFIVKFPSKKLEMFIKNDTIETKLKLIKTLRINNMHLYDKNKNIKKYNDVEEILLEWYDIRLDAYVRRKNFIINKLEKELELLKYKVIFIQNVINKKIIIYKQKKVDIIKKLEELKFPKLQITDKDKICYDYITNIQLFSLTIEKINELNEKFKEKENELNVLKNTSEMNIWKNELQILLKDYLKWKK